MPSRDQILAKKRERNKKLARFRYNSVAMSTERVPELPRKEEKTPEVTRSVSQKKEPLEQRVDRSLMRIRAEMSEQKTDILVTKKWFLDLPVLGAEEEGEGEPAEWWEPRYHKTTGVVYTTRWNDEPATKINAEGKKELKGAKGFVILKQPEHRTLVDLTSFPKSWQVSVLIPQKMKGITDALRQQDEVRGDFRAVTGVEYGRVEELFVATHGLFQKFALGIKEPQALQQLADEIVDLLDREGIYAARTSHLRDIEEPLRLALGPDSRGRRNPLVSRMRIFKVMRNLTRREVESWLTRRKADKVFKRLYVEWENQIFSLTGAKKAISELGGFGKEKARAHPIFRKKQRIKDEEITEVRGIIKEIKDALGEAKTVPFLLPAKLADAMIGSIQFRGKQEMRQLRKALKAKDLEGEMDRDSVEDLLMQRRQAAALVRLRQVYSLVESIVEDPDNYEITVFE